VHGFRPPFHGRRAGVLHPRRGVQMGTDRTVRQRSALDVGRPPAGISWSPKTFRNLSDVNTTGLGEYHSEVIVAILQ